MVHKPSTLWDRSRQLAVETILDTAVRLFIAQGYEETTIAQIAKEVGISQRSLFRYFGSKEDLVCGDQEQLGALLCRTVEEAPADMSAWDAVRMGFAVVATANHTPERALELTRLIFGTPSLHARYLEKRLLWQADLLPIVVARTGDAGQDGHVRARALIATTFACLDVATQMRLDGGEAIDGADVYDRCIASVRSGGHI
ncbi:TetR/AcrR family transcriptional regulator [Umezawaea endophytica]|uniref:TetR/AcrR family transcriptional regulator n=1 Tax=Umezawaea endophytica TaxID=1654476 RepID=A0A9X2VTS0_9PSEU|nr:TetR/AcrR family transcriptional regulator [Umezawaea endophytica]MCS7482501.1 TetR/AcrR family transcriptional regulator [Umezawaea endophytica]